MLNHRLYILFLAATWCVLPLALHAQEQQPADGLPDTLQTITPSPSDSSGRLDEGPPESGTGLDNGSNADNGTSIDSGAGAEEGTGVDNGTQPATTDVPPQENGKTPTPVSDADAAANAERLASLRQDAANLIAAKNFAGAEDAYGQMIDLDPNNVESRIGRGYARAWQGKYAAARTDFSSILQADPNNLSAINGLGYSYAWEGEFKKADEQFRRALKIEPGQVDASKGLAYSALWRGDGETAERRFSALAQRFPNEPEYNIALGQAQLAAGENRNARQTFQDALTRDPGHPDALKGLEASRTGRPILELTAWGGYTWFTTIAKGLDNPEGGIRLAEIAMNPIPDLRVWLQYDNGLAMDNLVLSRDGQNFPAYYVGGFYHYDKLYTTRIEAGWRDLPGQLSQRLFRFEQVVLLPKGYVAKAGGFIGPRDDQRTEIIGYGAVGIPVRENFKIEPTFFYSKSGIRFEHQWRLLVSGEYLFPKGIIAGAGLALGQESVVDGSNGVFDSFARVSIPINGLNHIHGLLRYETNGPTEAITVFSIGYTLGLSGL